MKILKTLATFAVALCLFSACADSNQNPNYEIANCGVIKDPLKDITWLREDVEYAIANKTPQEITMYDYKGEKLYHKSHFKGEMLPVIGNCNLTKKGICVDPGCSTNYLNFMQEAKNPIVLFEQK